MKMNQREFNADGTHYIIRSATSEDAQELSEIRLQIDGETENLDRKEVKHT